MQKHDCGRFIAEHLVVEVGVVGDLLPCVLEVSSHDPLGLGGILRGKRLFISSVEQIVGRVDGRSGQCVTMFCRKLRDRLLLLRRVADMVVGKTQKSRF